MPENNEGTSKPVQDAYEPEILEPEQNWHDGKQQDSRESSWNSRTWVYTSRNNDGCIASFISLALFIVTTSYCGLLGGIGFLFFHILIALAGSVIAARKLLSGHYFNIWQWRICNWLVSFMLVFWLAGE